MHPVTIMHCPQCRQLLTQVGQFWICPSHGHVIPLPSDVANPATSTSTFQQVFISYGREDAMDFAKRLAVDLQTQANYRVFLDLESIAKGALWEVRIERGIKESSVLLAILSPYAVREESVCRDEVVYALCEGKPIVPVRQNPDPQLRPPLLLARRNWVDFTVSYEQGFQALLQFLQGDSSALRPPALPTITGVVPLDFGVEIARFTHGFTGRFWLMSEIDRWLTQDTRRAMIIVAAPGVGKSALAAWLSQTRNDVIGIHFCTQQNARTRDPYEFVACLVSHLHARLPGFAEVLESRHPEIRRPDAKAAFRELIIEPIRCLTAPDHACLIVVDSLDESLAHPNETVLDVLVDQAKDLPVWLRIIATTRPEQPILHRIRMLNVFELLAERADNRADLHTYIVSRLQTTTLASIVGYEVKAIALQLDQLANGNFLYAHMALDALEEASLSVTDLDHLSVGLADFYTKAFSRKFPETETFQQEFAPLLSALVVARGPMPFTLLCRIEGKSPAIVNLRLNRLRSWLKVQEQNNETTYEIFHKSLQDWLANRVEAGDYWCDTQAGHVRLVEMLHDSWATSGYALRHLPAHLVASERWNQVCALLCDLHFVEARCREGQVFELQSDYRLVMDSLPERQPYFKAVREREACNHRWAADLIAYAQAWSRRRDRLERGELITEPVPALPGPIPSCRMWTDEEVQAECRRITEHPTWLDRLATFSGFVSSQCYPLLAHGRRSGFIVQHAISTYSAGPVFDAAQALLPEVIAPILLRHWPTGTPINNPKPALLCTLEGHSARIVSVSVTPDGRRAVSGSWDHTLRFWDLENTKCLRTLEGHRGPVYSVSVTPDGRRAVSGSDDKTLRVWDLESGQCLRTLEGHSARIDSVSVTPDGRRAVSGSDDKTLRIWDLESGQCLRTLEGHSYPVYSLSMAPDGRRAISGSLDHTLRVWDLESGQCLRTLEGHSETVYSVSMTPDSRRAVSGSWDHTLRVWDLESGQCLHTLEGHSARIKGVSMTPDGRRAISSSDDRTLRVWDLQAGQCLRILRGHSDHIESVDMTPDGRRAVSGSWDKTLRVWDLESSQCLHILEGHSNRIRCVSVTPDGRHAVSGSADKSLRVWDLESSQCLHILEGHRNQIRCVSITPDGQRAVSGSEDKTLRVWDLERGQCLHILEGHSDYVEIVEVTPDGRRAVSGSEDKTLRVWDLESGQCLRTLEGHSARIETVNVTPNSRCAVSGSLDQTLRVWDLENSQCIGIMDVHSKVLMTPDGRRVFLDCDDNTVRVCDLESGQCFHTLEGHSARIETVNVTPDGWDAVWGNLDKTLRVQDLESGQCRSILQGHNAEVYCVSVMPDGRHAISGNRDQTLRVWDLESGLCLEVFAMSAPVTTVAHFPGGVIVGTTTGEVLFLELRNFPSTPPK